MDYLYFALQSKDLMANTNLAAKGNTQQNHFHSSRSITVIGTTEEVLDHLQTFDELDALLDEQITVRTTTSKFIVDLLSGSSLILESFDQFEEPI